MVEFKNKENFKKWLDENVKAKVYDFGAYLDDIYNQYCETGRCEYELSSSESKDNLPHLYEYEIKKLYDEKYDCYNITIIL